jgi:O-antigen/teichoic acid export membrane protein
LLGAVPVGLALHLAASPIVHLFFGSTYLPAVPVVRTIGLLFPLLAVSVHGGYVLGATGKILTVAGLYALALPLNFLLNLALVPDHGAQGAALARLGSEAVLVVGVLAVLQVAVRGAPRMPAVATAVGAAMLGVIALAVPDPTLGVGRAVAYLAAVFVLYILSGALRNETAALRASISSLTRTVSAGGAS